MTVAQATLSPVDISMSSGEAASTYVVVPAFNESGIIRETVCRLLRLNAHVVVVDDGSTDGTVAALDDLPINVISHSINLGQGAAIQTGMDFALARGARYVVTFDGDGQHDEHDIPRVIRALVRDDLDVVLGSRFLGDAPGLGTSKRVLLKAAILFTRLTTRMPLTDVHNGLRAFRAEALKVLHIRHNRMAHASELLDQIRTHRLRYAEVPTRVRYTAYSMAKGQTPLGAVDILYDLAIRRWLR